MFDRKARSAGDSLAGVYSAEWRASALTANVAHTLNAGSKSGEAHIPSVLSAGMSRTQSLRRMQMRVDHTAVLERLLAKLYL